MVSFRERPDKRQMYGWGVVTASWLSVFCLFGYRATFAILKGPIAATLGWSTTEVTLGYSLMMVFYALTAYLCGLILDRWGARWVYSIAAIFGTLGFILTARTDFYPAYLFSFSFFGGIATGMLWVSSTVSVRKWYVGKTYGTMWGIAFSGAPVAQFILAQVVKPKLSVAQTNLDLAVKAFIPGAGSMNPGEFSLALALKLKEPSVLMNSGIREAMMALESAWRAQMTILGVIVFIALVLAVFISRNSPEFYKMKPFGEIRSTGGQAATDTVWSIREAFSTYAIWAAILVFLTSMVGEFLIWTQVVSYWTQDAGFSLKKATEVYGMIGISGIILMPLAGRISDRVVQTSGDEAKGRSRMLIAGPAIGAVASVFLLLSRANGLFAYLSCILFAFYWAIVPGGVVGYAGALYGRKTLGKIWGLATLIVMGTGPFIGSFAGAFLRDISDHYLYSVWFALGAFVLSLILAMSLPLNVKYKPNINLHRKPPARINN